MIESAKSGGLGYLLHRPCRDSRPRLSGGAKLRSGYCPSSSPTLRYFPRKNSSGSPSRTPGDAGRRPHQEPSMRKARSRKRQQTKVMRMWS